jgi:peptidoglycan/LPS O-acetylase OafA/YrhL
MKKMELHISLTFAIAVAVSLIVSGIYSVTSKNSSFINWDVMTGAFIVGVVYLGYIWMCTRKHKAITWLAVFAICLVIIFYGLSTAEGDSSLLSFNWYDFVMIAIFFALFQIAQIQGKKLLEEDEEEYNISKHYVFNIYPENTADTETVADDTTE